MIGVLVSGEGTNLQALIDAGLPVAAGRVEPGRRAGARARRAQRDRRRGLRARRLRRPRRSATRRWRLARSSRASSSSSAPATCTCSPPPSSTASRSGSSTSTPRCCRVPRRRARSTTRSRRACETTGVTVHLVDEGIDTGAVIRQEPVPVEPRGDARRARSTRSSTGCCPRWWESCAACADLRLRQDRARRLRAGLAALGCELVASGGTAAHLEELGLDGDAGRGA